MNRLAMFILLLVVSAVSAAEETGLYMFAKHPKPGDVRLQCAIQGAGASSEIKWSEKNEEATTELLFKPGEMISWDNIGDWREVGALDWSLPPLLNHYRWEKLRNWTTWDSRTYEGITKLPNTDVWSLGISVLVEDNAYMYLCAGGDPSYYQNCYWIVINGWANEGFRSVIRRCPQIRSNDRDCTIVETKQNRTGQEGDWLHLKIDWNKDWISRSGNLKVSYREVDNTFQTFLDWTDREPFTPTIFATNSLSKEGKWLIHNYTVMGLQSSAAMTSLISNPIPISSSSLCVYFFYIIYPNQYLLIDLVDSSTSIRLRDIRGDKSQGGTRWRGGQIPIKEEYIQGLTAPRLRISVPRTQYSRGGLEAVIDAVSVSECNAEGMLRVSTLKVPFNENLDIECYLESDYYTRVKWHKGVQEKATARDILAAGRLCSQANGGQMCEGTILCSTSHCACSPGYYAKLCRPACGQYSHTFPNKYGAGCGEDCGQCANKWSTTQLCHPITGACNGSACQGDYKPPMCRTRFLTMRHQPKFVKAEPNTLDLMFNLKDTDGDGTVASLEVQYKKKDETIGDSLVKEITLLPSSPAEMALFTVTLTELTKSTSYEVRGILVDTEGGRFSNDRYPPFYTFDTTCEENLQLIHELDENDPRTVKLHKMSSESDTSCGIQSYTLQKTYPQIEAGVSLTSFEVTLISLKPYTNYTFNLLGIGNNVVQTIRFKTLEDAPSSVRYLRANPTAEDSIELTWEEPSELNGQIQKYIVTYQLVKYLACQEGESSMPSNSAITTNTSIVLKDLTPYSRYKVTVTAVTTKPGPTENAIADTNETPVVNVAPDISKVEPDQTSVTITWSEPNCRSVRGLFHWSIRTSITITGISDDVANFSRSYTSEYRTSTFSELKPFSHYNATLHFMRVYGNARRVSYQDFWTKPSEPPPVSDLTVVESFSDSLTVRWAAPHPPLHGELESYTVKYSKNRELSRSTLHTLSPSMTSCDLWKHLNCHTLENLEENVQYFIQVTTRNKNVDIDVPATPVSETTKEKAPSEPLELTSEVQADGVTFTWGHPDKPNGRIRSFALSLTPHESWLKDTTVLSIINETMHVNEYSATYSHTVRELLPSTNYIVKVSGVTVEKGPSTSQQFVTPLVGADFPNDALVVESRTDTSATIIIPASPRQLTKESLYIVVVVPDKALEEHSAVRDNLTTSLLMREEILAMISDSEDVRARAWVVAQLEPQSESLRFVIGQNNYRLDGNSSYEVYVVVLNKQGTEKKYSLIKTDILSTSPTPAPAAPLPNGGLYALLLLLVCPAVGIYLLYRYTLMKKFRGGEQIMLYPSKTNAAIDMPSVTKPACPDPSVSPVAGPRILRPRSVIQSLSVPVPVPVPVPESATYVKICDLSNYVSRGLLTGDLKKQHEMFPRGQTKSWDYGQLPQNKQKNRYGNLIAYDGTRVVLDKLPDDPFSDYINANYIDGYRKPRMYIATQGPRLQTVVDFWRMVWQEQVQVISMLTNIVENGKAKCEQYWPDSGKEVTYGQVTILTGKVQVFADYTFRQFHLKSTANNETRKVLQLHFTSWPDHGVPLYPQSVASYLKKLLATPLGVGPLLVHCSAGVGRTGTIIVADACLRMAASEGAVDVLSFLRRTRDCRANMVDNYEQYKLIHLALIECLVTESTGLQCDGTFASNLKRLKESGTISKLYKRLGENPSADQEPDEDEEQIKLIRRQEMESRRHKNRVQEIVPGSTGLVFLSRLDVNDPVSDYINAVSVDGFRIKDQFIATQFPLETTTADFWRMVAEKQVSVVVLLNEVNLANKFWPTPGAVLTVTPYITVILKEESPRQHWITRQFLLIVKSDTDQPVREWQVTMLHLIGWNANDFPFNTSVTFGDGLLELWQETERVYSGEHPIVVSCYDGASACGLFLALTFMIEKMKLEQECDVVHAVRTVRHNRKQFLPTEMQFEWLYDAAERYLEAFETYANFH